MFGFAQLLCVGLLVIATTVSAPAFNGHFVKEGPLAMSIAEIPTVTELEKAQPVMVNVTNTGSAPLKIDLQLTGLADETRAAGLTNATLQLEPGTAGTANFQILMGRGSHSALYPVHVVASFAENGQKHLARAIRIFQTRFVEAIKPAANNPGTLPENGILQLRSLVPEITVQVNTPAKLDPGFRGSDPLTGGSFDSGSIDRGGSRQALIVHPPYKTGAGTLFLDYKVRLPAKAPISLHFYNAIRDNSAAEPASDGITFRVLAQGEKVFEQHTASKSWLAGQADLSRWAGQEIVLRLESHPGPKLNTVCDSGYWADAVLVSGEMPVAQTDEERAAQLQKAKLALAGAVANQGATVFDLGQGMRAAIVPGRAGLADAVWAFGSGQKSVAFEGFRIALFDQVMGEVPAGARVLKVEKTTTSDGQLRLLHRVSVGAEPEEVESSTVEVLAEIRADRGALRLKITSPARITDLAPGRSDQAPTRVYYGHGYVIDRPGKFRANGGGHDLSTSHVAADYASGISLLVACDTPPDFLDVDPSARVFALHTHTDSTFTFVPGTNGGLETALRFRPLSEKKAAPAFDQKAGRFVFDIWGGRYAKDAELLRRCFAYGLTNSLAIMHVWQRWGYDYRLPDIFPPLPSLGTLEELRGLGEDCAAAGALWGLHDNYIDIYPDAEGFSYENVTFHKDGRPREAWLNEGRNAQSYQFRPDKVAPFLDRNLKLIAPALKATASFVDVWTSLNAFDYYDRQGKWHSKMETLRAWGEGFANIQRALGGAPTTSEAGSDQLIGWLEGADAQFMQISDSGEQFCKNVPCADWERVPWFDAVHHRRFSLHGVGYSSRYEGGLSRELHGILSDDYLSAEMLTGHALMIDLPGMTRGAVRKYWLAQEFIESIAHDDIAAVELAGGDLHRIHVRWNSGADVWVNRGNSDWTVEGRILPRYGYLARNGRIVSSIEKLGNQVVEQSSSPAGRYYNARGAEPDAPLPIVPQALGVEHLGGRQFRLLTRWQAAGPAPRDLDVFYHFKKRAPGRYTELECYSGGKPAVPTSQWQGAYQLGSNWVAELPAHFPPGEYQILVGLFDAKGNWKRYRLQGDERADRRYFVGKLSVEAAAKDNPAEIKNIRFIAPDPARPAETPASSTGSVVDFGIVRTSGGFKLTQTAKGATLLPLPDGPEFAIALSLPELLGNKVQSAKAQAINAAGIALRAHPCKLDGSLLRITTKSGDFGYLIEPVAAAR